MGDTYYERLSAMDAALLRVDDINTHDHIGAVATFEAAPLMTPEGELDFTRIRAAIDAALPQTRRFRQKLAFIPLLDHPVWIDDARFNLDYHVRHTALPRPGGLRLLKRLAGRIVSQKLDLRRPLWELWVVEGVEEERFAVVVKAHHCMVDGVAGIDLLTSLMSPVATDSGKLAPRWIPRPPPPGTRMLVDELSRRATYPMTLAASGWRALLRPRESLKAVQEGIENLGQTFKGNGGRASSTPFEAECGAYRRVDWLRVDVEAALEVRSSLGGTLNDVVLATAAGGFGRFLQRRGVRIDDLDFRSLVPVNTRPSGDAAKLGNKVSIFAAKLPIAETDPRKRLAATIEVTREFKQAAREGGMGWIAEISDRLAPSLIEIITRLVTPMGFANTYVSNIPGPRIPVYLLGSRMLEIYPVAPVVHTLAVAVLSYDKGLHWGFDADWDAFPDLHDLVEDTELEFERLRKVVSQGPPC